MMPTPTLSAKPQDTQQSIAQPRREPRSHPRRWTLLLFMAVVPFLMSCYTVTLRLQMDEAGQGVAWVYMDYHVPEGQQVDASSLNATLQKNGWTTEAVAGSGSGSEMASGYKTFTEGDLNSLIQSVPGFENTGSTMSLKAEEDPTLGIKQFTFQSRLVMSGHLNNWATIETAAQDGLSVDCNETPLDSAGEDCGIDFSAAEVQQMLDESGPIRFRLDLNLPGEIDDVNGEWTDPQELSVDWQADGGAEAIPLRAVTVYHPGSAAPDNDTFIANQQQLLDRFTVELGNGQIVSDPSPIQNYLTAIFGPGRTNNMTNGKFNACGWWQGEVLKWLDSIRLNPDPKQRALLDGLDYGPIQAYFGGHQAVVLFPKGSNWQDSGMVLDPWPEQIPQSSSIADWKATFGIGSTFGGEIGIGPGQRNEDYPQLTGGPSSYPDTLTQVERLHFRRIAVNSPVNVLVSGPGGLRLGALADGTIVNEIPGADFYPPDESSGERVWYFGLPEGDYSMEFTGEDAGDMHVLLAGEGQELVTYGAQPVSRGGTSTLQLHPGEALNPPLMLEGGEMVEPRLATLDALQEVYGDVTAPPDASKLSLRSVLLALGGTAAVAVCCGLPVLALLAFLVIRGRKKAGPSAGG